VRAVVVWVLGFGIAGAGWTAENGAPSPPNAIELNNRAVRLAKEAHYAEAEALYRASLDAWSQAGNGLSTRRDRARTSENLGALLRDIGRYPEAQKALTVAVAELEETTGKSSPDVGEALENLGALYRAMGDLDQAEASALRADGILQEPERTNNRILLGAIYTEQRRFAEARAIMAPALPGSSGKLGFALNANLAAVALAEHDFSEAERFTLAAFNLASSNLEPNNVALAALYSNMGQVYRFQERYEEAERAYRKAIDMWTAARGATHPYVGSGLMNLAAFEHERGRDHAAEDLYRRAADILDRGLGADSLQTLVARNELGEVLRAEKRYVASEQLSRATLPLLQKLLPANDPRVVRAETNYLHLLADTKRQAQAAVLAKGLGLR